jgi:bacteriorhodopsin
LLSEYREWELAPSLILAGLVGDLLLARLAGRPGPVRVGHVRLFAGLMPVVLWSLFFLCVALLEGGLGWGATLWVGILCSSAGVGYALSLLVFPPYMGAAPVEQVPEAPATVVEAGA